MRRYIPLLTILMIGTISAASMATGLTLGEGVAGLLPPLWEHYLSAGVFFVLSLWFVWQGISDDTDEVNPKRQEIGTTGGVLLGLALGLNTISLGFSGGLAGYDVISTSLWTGAVSFTFLLIGTRFAGRLNFRFIHVWGDYISATFLFILGVIQLPI